MVGVLEPPPVFFLRRDNFGFAAPAGALALAEAVPGPAADRRLVIARHESSIYARRLVRGSNANVIGLTAEIPDLPIRNPPSRQQTPHKTAGQLVKRGRIRLQNGLLRESWCFLVAVKLTRNGHV
jgi:hypothetical protein